MFLENYFGNGLITYYRILVALVLLMFVMLPSLFVSLIRKNERMIITYTCTSSASTGQLRAGCLRLAMVEHGRLTPKIKPASDGMVLMMPLLRRVRPPNSLNRGLETSSSHYTQGLKSQVPGMSVNRLYYLYCCYYYYYYY